MIRFREKTYSNMNKSSVEEIVEKLEKERIEDFEVREYISDTEISINTDLDNIEVYIPKDADFAKYDIEDFISDMLPYSSINSVIERRVIILKVRGKMRKDQYLKLVKFIIEEEGFIVIKSPEYVNYNFIMSQENMASKYLDKANRTYEVGMKNIKLQLKILGTDLVVLRPKENSKWKKVFGGSYMSDSTLENDYDKFTTRLIINMNELRDVWARNRDNLEVYSDKDDLNVGDELQYTRENRTYRFKVIQKLSYSEVAKNVYVYTLSSMVETKDNGDGFDQE